MAEPTKNRHLRFAEQYARYLESKIDDHVSPKDTMFNQWYNAIGKDAATAVYGACVVSYAHQVRAVLDLPCGHGRVLRHLVKLFPDAAFDVCDIDRDGMEFCASRFGARPLQAHEDLTQMRSDRKYDLIWSGSLFTHVSRPRTRQWLAHLAGFLSDAGIIVATFHGRYSAQKGLKFGYIEEPRWQKILREYEASGYGYEDYPPNKGNHIEWIAGSYGVSLSSPAAVVADVLDIPETRVFSYTERGWAGHQDVLVLGKPHLMA
jgi:SAM-dependent methyltransferase